MIRKPHHTPPSLFHQEVSSVINRHLSRVVMADSIKLNKHLQIRQCQVKNIASTRKGKLEYMCNFSPFQVRIEFYVLPPFSGTKRICDRLYGVDVGNMLFTRRPGCSKSFRRHRTGRCAITRAVRGRLRPRHGLEFTFTILTRLGYRDPIVTARLMLVIDRTRSTTEKPLLA